MVTVWVCYVILCEYLCRIRVLLDGTNAGNLCDDRLGEITECRVLVNGAKHSHLGVAHVGGLDPVKVAVRANRDGGVGAAPGP